jgi:hypothetical protein
MAATGRISGPLLKANLVRNGIDIAVETDLLYFDVTNSRIGVNNGTPGVDLDVTGTTQTTLLLADQATVDNVDINGNDITVLSGNLRLTGFDAAAGVEANDLLFTQNQVTTTTAADGSDILIDTNTDSSVIINGRLTINDAANTNTKLSYGTISINGDPAITAGSGLIESTLAGQNLELQAGTSGSVITNSATQIGTTGNIKNLIVTGNLRVDGNITIGDETTDGITIGAEFESNLVPNSTGTYDLGTSSQTWLNAYSDNGYLGDLLLSSNDITTTIANTSISITPTGTGNVVMNTNKSLVLPIGTSAERPADTTGAIRWNTTNNSYEAYNATPGIDDWAVLPLGSALVRYQFTADSGQQVFSGIDDNGNTFSTVSGGTEIVIRNGIVLEEGEEYTTDATSLTLVDPVDFDTDVNVIVLGVFRVGDVVAKSTGGTFEGGIIVDGNFSVINGSNTVFNGPVNTTDRIVSIGTGNSGSAPTGDDNQDRGINFKWHDGSTAKNGFFGFDDSTGYFTFVPDATITTEVASGTQGDIQATTFRGNVVASDVTSDTMSLTSALPVTSGGTGLDTATQGDILIGNGADSLGPLTIGAANTVLTSNGSAPAWSTSLNLAGTLDVTGVITQTDTTQSTSVDTGAIITDGGAGIAQNLYVGGLVDVTGVITQTDTTQSTSVDTGAIITDGGAGIAQNLYVGGNATITGDLTVNGNTNINSASLTTTSTTLILADGVADATAANGAGIVVDLGTDGTATLAYASATDRFVFDKNVEATTFVGALTGNADTAAAWATARTISVSGAVTGSVSVDGTGNVDIATTAASDPTLTLDGDATGSATFTDLGNATLTVSVDGGNAATVGTQAATDFTLDYVTGNGSTTTNAITAGDITATGTFFGNVQGNVVGTLEGEMSGSVFGDDSTILVDGINNTIPGYVSLQTLKDVTAASADFTDFQTRIANL